MTGKNVETMSKSVNVDKTSMTKEQMEQFVNENLGIIPRNCNKKFESLKTIEEKVAKIQYYIDAKKLRDEMTERNKLENKVKQLFIRQKATTEDVVRVIDFCKEYLKSTKEDEISKLQNEIDRLTHLKQTLENN